MNYLIWKKNQKSMTQGEYDELKRVFVTVEPRDGCDVHIDLWRGHCVAVIHRLAKLTYKDCDIQFGNWF